MSIEERYDEVRQMITVGKEKGYLLYDEINELLPSEITSAEDLDEDRFAQFLYTKGQPDPDLLIRTSGEMRVSNFLLWQIAYAEIWVTDTLWPDFRKRDLLEAILAYQKRDRRYGGINQPAVAGR